MTRFGIGAVVLVALCGLAARADDVEVRLAPKAFRAAVERIRPSLVVIETHGGGALPAPGRRRPSIGGFSKPGEGATTGVIVGDDGHILTSAFNFIGKPQVITVTLSDGSRHVAKQLGRDDTRSLCLLKIEVDRKLPVPVVSPRRDLRVGQWAVSVGVGYGGEAALSTGILSALSRIYGRAVQTDANISPANYGGPLLDIEGRVIGICAPLSPNLNSALAGTEWYDSGIGFAVPLDGLERAMAAMKRGETIRQGLLGILFDASAAPNKGVPVMKVAKESPAEKAGLKPKDVVLAIDDHRLLDAADLRLQIGARAAGDAVRLTIRRGEKEETLTATLAAPEAK